MKTLNTSIIPFLALIGAIPAFAGVPDVVTYAGTLKQGQAPADGTFSVVFELFDADSGGNRVFQQTEASLAVSQGELVADLGSDPTNPLGDDILAINDGALFLNITVNGEALEPRVAFTAVPFARLAANAEHADVASKADDADTLGGLAVEDILNVFTATDGLVRNGDAFSIAANGVTSAKILDGTIVGADIAAAAIGAANMGVSSVNSSAILDNAVGTAELANEAVTAVKIKDFTITANDLQANSVTREKLGSSAVGTDELATGAVTARTVDGIKLVLEPSACGGHLRAMPGAVAVQCRTEACEPQFGGQGFFNCSGTCNESVPKTCQVSTTAVGFMVAP